MTETGAKIVSINPMPEAGNFRFKNPQDLKNPLRAPGFFLGKATELSDLWLPVRIMGVPAGRCGSVIGQSLSTCARELSGDNRS